LRRLGLIINPIAGMGGPVGLHGTDGADTLTHARALGAVPRAQERTIRALRQMARTGPHEILAASGAMGEDALAAGGLASLVVHPAREPSGAGDTREAARTMAAAGAGAILFAGGDGTARDVFEAVGRSVLLLGIPTGVKMHSAVFAVTPEAAGQLAARLLDRTARIEECDAEVMDRDEAGPAAPAARLFGYARTPRERRLIQSAKAGIGTSDEGSLDAACAAIAASMQPGRLYLLGPGTTTARILEMLGMRGSLLGVDAVRDGAVLGRDLSEDDVLRLLGAGPATAIVGVIGGQGCLFGRGNQQIGALALRRIGRDNVVVVATFEKLASLAPQRLFVDTGDPAVDAMFDGYIQVVVGPGRTVMMRVDGRLGADAE
jgi:predicted polyphosphate/ATP-dependent NAD kinase